MPAIFISYRREDSAGWTGRLAERLKQKFGTESIFMDIDTIQPGTDFAEALRAAVGACDLLLAMIGPEWCLAKNSEGQPRLEDSNDWVRMELTAALSRSIPVIPVLVGGASLPKLAALPDDLKKLFQYQEHELTDKRWEYDSNQLVQVLEKVVRGAKPKRDITQTILAGRSTWVALVVLGLLLAIGTVSLLRHGSDTETQILRESVQVPKESVQKLEDQALDLAGKLLEAVQTPEGIKQLEKVVAEKGIPAGPVSIETQPSPSLIQSVAQQVHLPDVTRKHSGHPYEVRVSGISTVTIYVEQFGGGKTIRPDRPNDVLMVLHLRLINHSDKLLRAVLMKEHPGNTALVDSEGRFYSPSAYDARVTESKQHYLIASVVSDTATDFALVFSVPQGIIPKSLRLTAIDGHPVTGESIDLVADFQK